MRDDHISSISSPITSPISIESPIEGEGDPWIVYQGHSKITKKRVTKYGHLPRFDDGDSSNPASDKLELPLPFGYHLDLDFLRVCSDSESVSSETLDRLTELRKQRRKQRKTLEALMGMRKDKQSKGKTLYITTGIKKVAASPPVTTPVNPPESLGNAIREAVTDFEQCLEKSQLEDERYFSEPDLARRQHSSRFSTFPRAMPSPTPPQDDIPEPNINSSLTSTFKLYRPPIGSTSSLTSTMSTSSSMLSNLPSNVRVRDEEELGETESVGSITSEMGTQQLKVIRDQMAISLQKLKEYEKQIESIPVIQVKLQVMKEEKRMLMLKLKQMELRLKRKESDVEDPYDFEDSEDEMEQQINEKRRFQDSFLDRARSVSPYNRGGTENPDRKFTSVKKTRSSSCGYNSDYTEMVSPDRKSVSYWRKTNPYYSLERSELSFYTKGEDKESREMGTNTEKMMNKIDHSTNTDPLPKPPAPPKTVTTGVNTLKMACLHKVVQTIETAEDLVTKQEMLRMIQENILKTEEEILGCPLLQRAMQVVEDEALYGPRPLRSELLLSEVGCQVDEAKPSVSSVGLQCKIEEPQKTIETKSVGVEIRVNRREIGVCTERWVEVIKASKQTDTDDFAYKDTESPRVADMVFEPSPERVVLERRSSLRNSPKLPRKTSSTKSTMTEEEEKVVTKDAQSGTVTPVLKSVAVETIEKPRPPPLSLPGLSKFSPAPGSPIPDKEKVNLCDKCDRVIHKAAENVIEPPSPDMPWLSKIPRPVPENRDVQKLKPSTSIDNLTSVPTRPMSPLLQRSKSSLTPSVSRRMNCGTPPPHPSAPSVLSKRAPSPLARSQSPADKRSMIPRLSPGTTRKQLGQQQTNMSKSMSPSDAVKSLIPRVATPPALRKMYPQTADKLATPDRKVIRKSTVTKLSVGVANKELDKEKAEENKETSKSPVPKSKFPLPGAALFAPIDDKRTKYEPSKEMKAALKVLNDSLKHVSSTRGNAQVTNAINLIQQEWFKTSSTKQSNPLAVEDYLDVIEDMSSELLARVVNLTDVNGNTALHYSVSHGNFDVVSVLLDSKVANPNILNKAGYTCIMLVSLAQIQNSTHKSVVARLFSTGDVNLRGSQHGQTSLMLAVSHGRQDMVELLLDAGADVNVRDEDGSTALMCAAEHGHMGIVKLLLQQPDVNVLSKDNDGLTALAVAMEAGHRDVGVVLYANMSFSRGTSPFSSMRIKRNCSGASTPVIGILTVDKMTESSEGAMPTGRIRRSSSNQ